MSVSLRALSSHTHHIHVKATPSPSIDDSGLDDALNSAANSDPSSDPTLPAIDAGSPGQVSSAFAALLNQLLTDSPSSALSTPADGVTPGASSDADGMTPPGSSASDEADPTVSSTSRPDTGTGDITLDSLFRAVTASATGSA